eukprot:jgi/Psemu1/44599/gm1.44599_g
MAPGAMGFKTTTKQLPAKAIKQKSKRKHGKTSPSSSTIHQTYKHLSEIKPNNVNFLLKLAVELIQSKGKEGQQEL